MCTDDHEHDKKTALLVAISIFGSGATALAAELIVGAWGIQLGKVWDSGGKAPDVVHDNGSKVYRFAPSNPTPGIELYHLTTTPDNVVYNITGFHIGPGWRRLQENDSAISRGS